MKKILIISLFIIFAYSSIVYSTESLALNMTFNTADGIYNSSFAQDLSGFGRNSTFLNATFTTNGKNGQAYYFDKNGVFNISVFKAYSADLANITACAWVNTSYYGASGVSTTIVGQYDTVTSDRSWSMDLSQGYLRVILSTDGSAVTKGYNSSMPIANGSWIHTCFTFGNSALNLYINGVNDTLRQNGTDTAMSTIKDTTLARVTIGSRRTDGTAWINQFNGSIDEVLIFNKTLSSNEILNLYNSYAVTPPITSSNLLLNITFDNTTGIYNTTFAQDLSSYNHSANVTGASIVYSTPMNTSILFSGGIVSSNSFRTLGTSNTTLTVMAWVNYTGNTEQTFVAQWIALDGQRSWVLRSSSGYFSILISQDGTLTNYKNWRSSSLINDGTWHHVALTIKGGEVNMFIDGSNITSTVTKSVDSAITKINNVEGIANVTIGRREIFAQMTGNVYGVQIYNETLNAAQITAQYNLLNFPSTNKTYYVNSTGGNDANDGLSPSTAWKTTLKVNSTSLAYGSIVRFARNEIWRVPIDGYFEGQNGVTYTDYGAGNLPKIYGSYNGSNTACWINQSNYWNFTCGTNVTDIVNIVMNGETIVGDWVGSYAALNTQKEFYGGGGNNVMTMYSTANPATLYTDIEVVQGTNAYHNLLRIENKQNITIENLDFRYGGNHGVAGSNTKNIQIYNCSFSFIGGAGTSTVTNRRGNCIEFMGNAENIIVSYNNITNCFDAGVTSQSFGEGKTIQNNITFSYNILAYNGYGIEYFVDTAGTNTSNMFFDHNTIAHSGRGWYNWSTQQRDIYAMGIRMGGSFNTSNINITNNIIINTTYTEIEFNTTSSGKWIYSPAPYRNYNLFYNGSRPDTSLYAMFQYWASYNSLAKLHAVYPNVDLNSVDIDPQLNGMQPVSGSPACSMSSTGSYVGALPCSSSATTYYVSQSGSDSNDGLTILTPIKTIAKLNTLSLNAGDTVLFNGGDKWRIVEDDDLSVVNGVTYSSYGTGKAIFDGSINASLTGNWTDLGSNIWRYAKTHTRDFGALVLNDTIQGNKSQNLSQLKKQWDFAYNTTSNILYVYSTANPASLAYSVELTTGSTNYHLILFDGNENVTFDNLKLKNGGFHGFSGGSTDNIIIRNCTLENIGGAYIPGQDSRYGNCIQLGQSSNHSLIKNNIISQCYDAGITHQVYSGSHRVENAIVTNNIVTHAHYPYEYFSFITSGSRIYNITLEQNTFIAGAEWSYNQRPDGGSTFTAFSSTPVNTTNFTVRNNIFMINISLGQGAQAYTMNNGANNWQGAFTTYNNLFYNLSGGNTRIIYNNTAYANLAALQAAKPLVEVGSIESNPLFVSGTYQPSSGSPACTMSSTGSYVGALPCAEATATILYVNQSNAACDDTHTRTEAQSTDTPWCGLLGFMTAYPPSATKLQSGDQVYIASGEYNYQNLIYLEPNGTLTSPITITGLGNVNITHYFKNYTNLNQGYWTNMSSLQNGRNMWKTNVSKVINASSYNSFTLSASTPVQYKNGTLLLPNQCFNMSSSSDGGCVTTQDTRQFFMNYSRGILYDQSWINTTTKEVWVSFKDLSINPNTIPLYISGEEGIEIHDNPTNNGWIIWENTTFKYQKNPIQIYNSSNVEIRNNVFEYSLYGQRWRGKITRGNNLTSHDNIYYGKWTEGWYWDFSKTTYIEGATIQTDSPSSTEGMNGSVFIYNETAYNSNGGITLLTGSDVRFQMCGSQIYNNKFYRSLESTLEIEEYCCNTTWHDNKLIGGGFGVSFGGAQSTKDKKCLFYNNFVYANETVINNEYNSDKAVAVKYYNPHGTSTNVTYWNITHNTIYGDARAMYGIRDTTVFFQNNSITNNIFLSNNWQDVDFTGEAGQGNFWDYNLYYRYNASAGFALLSYWANNTVNKEFDTLAAAVSSSQNNGNWDLHSIESNPLLDSNFIPASNSPVCNAASDGGDIGALECALGDVTSPNITVSSPLFTTYHNHNITINFTARDETNLSNLWYYNNSVNVSYTNGTVQYLILPDGSYTLYFYANDTSNNIGFSYVTFIIETTTPPSYSNNKTNILTPYNYTPNAYYQFNITWSDNAGISQSILSWNGTNYTMQNNGNEYYYNFTNLLVGNYTYYFTANDTNGNRNTTSVYDFSITNITSVPETPSGSGGGGGGGAMLVCKNYSDNCSFNSDCCGSYTCNFGVCSMQLGQQCIEDEECANGLICINSVCTTEPSLSLNFNSVLESAQKTLDKIVEENFNVQIDDANRFKFYAILAGIILSFGYLIFWIVKKA